MPEKAPKRILILGGGFAGMYAALHLEKIFSKDKDVEITLVNRDNFFLFTPMLSEVPSSSIETRHVTSPIRAFFNKVSFQEAEVHSIDLKKRIVTSSHCPRCRIYHLEYDYLVLALGSVTSFYGLPGVAENSFPMKTLADAMALRNHVIDMFEHADLEQDAQIRRQLLTFVVAGGGFAGVEVAAELNDFAHASRKYYRNVHPDEVKLILVTPDSRIMPEISEDLAAYALNKLHRRGIEFRLQTKIVSAASDKVELDSGDHIPTNTLIWTAGITPDPIIGTLPCEKDKRGRIVVNEYLEVPDWPGVWALGDCAHIPDSKTGNPYPSTAQHAVREGKQAAHNIAATIRAKDKDGDKKPFQFSSIGTLAPLGHRTAVAEIKGFKFSGFFAWWLWRTIYLSKLPGLDRKIRVALDWTLNLFFPRDIVQLKVFMKPNIYGSSLHIQKKTLKENRVSVETSYKS